MKWEKPSEAIIQTFDAALPDDKRVEKRKMFGMPAAFVNGNMFCSVFQQDIMVKLSAVSIDNWIKNKKAKPFEPMPGRPMKEYIGVPKEIFSKPDELKKLFKESFDYAVTLKPKK